MRLSKKPKMGIPLDIRGCGGSDEEVNIRVDCAGGEMTRLFIDNHNEKSLEGHVFLLGN